MSRQVWRPGKADRASANGSHPPPGPGPKPKPRRGGVGAFLGFVLSLGVLAAALAVGAAAYVLHAARQPGPHAQAVTVMLPRGSGLAAIAARLQAQGVVRHRLVFRAFVTLQGDERALKAGEYAIPAGASLADIAAKLRAGDVVEHAVTAAEGLTSQMIVDLLNASDLLTGEIAAVPPEGRLLPETYKVTRGDSRQAILDRMAKAQEELLAELWPERAEGLPFDTIEEALILASIVEKETALPHERPRIAAVFVNRLKRPMRLETDPTVIYGLTKGRPLGRGLRRSELDDKKNPYNTYEHDGLTPTPICNPGRDSIAAVLNPPPSKELFFVADGTGGHVFAATYAEHLRNVDKWRRIEAGRGGAGQ